MRLLKTLCATFAACLCALPHGLDAAGTPAPPTQILQGQFALQGQKPMTEAHLKVTPEPGKPLTDRLDLWMNLPGNPAAVRSYQVEMTKQMHMVIVRDDFKVFLHVHPALRPDGHLLLTQTFPTAGTYEVYTDGLPNQMNHQVFRFELNVGQPTPPARNLQPTGLGVQAGPYEIDLSKVRLHAGVMEQVDVAILKDGKPATDLHPYLGSPAHAVFLNSQDLSYVHVHPMAPGAMMQMSMDGKMNMDAPPMPENGPSPASMMLHLALHEPGVYKLWLQFRGGTQLYVAEFTITAS